MNENEIDWRKELKKKGLKDLKHGWKHTTMILLGFHILLLSRDVCMSKCIQPQTFQKNSQYFSCFVKI
jgi:hypothetical protein